jgi:hypothetical protein
VLLMLKMMQIAMAFVAMLTLAHMTLKMILTVTFSVVYEINVILGTDTMMVKKVWNGVFHVPQDIIDLLMYLMWNVFLARLVESQLQKG